MAGLFSGSPLMTHSSTFDRRIDTSFHLSRRFVGALAACALCIGFASTAAIAQDQGDAPGFDASSLDANLAADPLAIEAPDGSPAIANWDFDPAFAAHGWGIDRFSDSPAKNYYGRKIARLDNGDIVVAGLVPRSSSSTSDQLGLVRYTAAGRRIAWTNVDPAWARYSNQYIVYPNGSANQPSGAFVSVVGLQEYDSNLYVMVNEQSADGAVHPFLLVFAESGFFRGWWTYFPSGSNQKPGTGFAISASKLIVLGADPSPINWHPQMWMSRYTITENGGLSFDDDFGSGGFAFYNAYACQVAATAFPCDTYPAAIAPTGGTIQLASPKFYVAASVKGSGRASFATVTMRFNGDGSRDTTFNYSTTFGYDGTVDFDDGGDNADIAVAIRTTTHLVIPAQIVEDVYVVSKVSRLLQPGIGVVRMDGSGNLVPGFGVGGKVLFGGCGAGGAAGGNCQFSNVEHIPLAMTLSGGYLGIAGWYRGFNGTVPHFTYPMFAVVNATNGTVDNNDEYTIGIGDAVFYDVVGNGDGTFTMAGDGRESANGNNVAYLTARLQPHDVIFRNGFD